MDVTVLCIEDDPLNMRLIRGILNTMGYTVLEAMTGELGLEIAKDDKPDIVIMDYHLPGIDGLEATQLFKQHDDLRDIPIIAITADLYARQAFMSAGCVAYMTKPLRRTTLLRTITQVLLTGNKRLS